MFPRRSQFSSQCVDQIEMQSLEVFRSIKQHEDLSKLQNMQVVDEDIDDPSKTSISQQNSMQLGDNQRHKRHISNIVCNTNLQLTPVLDVNNCWSSDNSSANSAKIIKATNDQLASKLDNNDSERQLNTINFIKNTAKIKAN